jgi:nicotinate-nucleotide pyrophosphorylase (carboxylating)
MTVEGTIQSILSAERTALNFLGHLSGIATLTRQFVDRVEGLNVRITDTRKTTPGWRLLEKQAVKAGGGENHRMGLYDMVLIKENHIEAAGGITKAVQKASSYLHRSNLSLKIEVETTTLDEVNEACKTAVDRIMLDNMSIEMMKKAVKIVDGNKEVEASGGVNFDSIRSIAETGVDYISVGALTHSAPAFDFSLLLKS